jgi:hypothetical protein
MPTPFGAWGELANICRPAKPPVISNIVQGSNILGTYSPPLYTASSAQSTEIYLTAAGSTYPITIQTQQQFLVNNYAYQNVAETYQYQDALWQQQYPNEWYRTYGTGTYSTLGWVSSLGWQPETPEQKAERRRQAHLDDLAATRAKALLLELLTEEQKAEYAEFEYFHVIGQSGKLYRIKRGSAGNVYSIGLDGNEEHKYCIHARDSVPHEDNMIAQYGLLRTDEEQFLSLANRHW